MPVVGVWKYKLALLGKLFDYVIPMKAYLCCCFFLQLKIYIYVFLHFFTHLNIHVASFVLIIVMVRVYGETHRCIGQLKVVL